MEWINVKDRLPPEKEIILAWALYPSGGCDLTDIYVCRECFYAPGYSESGFVFREYDCSYEVTHWMPLPEGPKE